MEGGGSWVWAAQSLGSRIRQTLIKSGAWLSVGLPLSKVRKNTRGFLISKMGEMFYETDCVYYEDIFEGASQAGGPQWMLVPFSPLCVIDRRTVHCMHHYCIYTQYTHHFWDWKKSGKAAENARGRGFLRVWRFWQMEGKQVLCFSNSVPWWACRCYLRLFFIT